MLFITDQRFVLSPWTDLQKTMKNVELLLWFLCLVKKKWRWNKTFNRSVYAWPSWVWVLCKVQDGVVKGRDANTLLVYSKLVEWHKEVCSQALEFPRLKTESNPDKRKKMHRYSHKHWTNECLNDYLVPQKNDYIHSTARPFLLSPINATHRTINHTPCLPLNKLDYIQKDWWDDPVCWIFLSMLKA